MSRELMMVNMEESVDAPRKPPINLKSQEVFTPETNCIVLYCIVY